MMTIRRLPAASLLAVTVLGLAFAPGASAQFHSSHLQPSEVRFVQNFYQQVIANQRMSELAMNKGQSRDVRELGANVSRDLRHAREDLHVLARNTGVHLSDDLTASNRAAASRLSNAVGSSFDRTYVDILLQQLPQTLQESRQIAGRTRSDELRSYLNRVNPRIERVISEAQTARARL
jgi:predicted outer membrane protein